MFHRRYFALYAYTHVAQEGGFVLDGYDGIQQWLKSMQQLDGFVAMGA
jgi:glutathione S-transferase